MKKVERPQVPCGQVMGHGESCCKDRLCGSCEYIMMLEKKLGIKQKPDPFKSAKQLETLWFIKGARRA